MRQQASPFKWWHYEAEIILLCVRWYFRYSLSCREEMMNERRVCVDHTTIFRSMQRYAPEINKRTHPHLKLAGASYRADETYVKAGKTWK